MIDYGVDVSCRPGKGLDPFFRTITSNELLGEIALRRIFCAPGSYLQAPSFKSIDLISELNKATREVDTVGLSSRASAAIMADERFEAATANVTFNGGLLRVSIRLTPSNSPPFTLVVTVANVATDPTFTIAFPPG